MNNSSVNKGAGIFLIFLRGILIYIGHFLPLSRVMLFPVFGQLLGVALIFTPVYFYRQYLDSLPVEALHGNVLLLLGGMVLMTIPGFAIFIKAFWEYMVAMVSLNTMVADIAEKEGFEDFKAHNKAVNRRKKDYISLLFILMGIWLVLLAAPFAAATAGGIVGGGTLAGLLSVLSSVICMIMLVVISVYLCLAFQVFAFEKLSPVETLKRSYSLVKNNFCRAVLLGVMVNILTGGILPAFVQSIAEMQPIMNVIVIPFKSYYELLAGNPVIPVAFKDIPIHIDVPVKSALAAVGTIVTVFVLPLGSACFTLLYMDLKRRKDA